MSIKTFTYHVMYYETRRQHVCMYTYFLDHTYSIHLIRSWLLALSNHKLLYKEGVKDKAEI